MPFLYHQIDQALRFGFAVTGILPGQHHGHGGHRVNQIHQPAGSAQARMQAQQHFRCAHGCAGHRYAVVATQSQLKTTAKRCAVNHRHRRVGQVDQSLDQPVSAGQLFAHFLLAVQMPKLLDISSHAEASRLARAQHQARGRIVLQGIQHLTQLLQYIG